MHVELKSPIAPIPRASSPRPAQNLPVKRPASLSTGASHSGTPDFQPKPDPPHPDHNIYHERRRPLVTTLGWDINAIIASSPNFHRMGRVHYSSPAASIGINEYEKDGVPLIIQGWHRHPRWPKSMFNVEWLQKNGDQNPTVRNVHNWTDFKITIEEFIQKLRNGSPYASADEQERLYGKDGECPAAWTEWLTEDHVIPKELLFDGSNDFLKFLPDTAKVQTLMCYVGIGDTFTPFHKDLCGSSGQNLMCYTEHSGSSFWFMTKASAAPQVTAYFHQLGQELDLETHVVTIEELARAPFDVYIAEQQTGDLVLVPPRSCHQVVNKGGITIKTSWSRMSLDGLQTALWHELPIYHRVCRQEIYKVKSIIFHAVQHFTSVLENPPANSTERDTIASAEQLKQLVVLFDDVLASDYSTTRDSMPHVSQSGSIHKDDLHCDFCGADVFQSFFECDSCTPMPSSEASGILAVGDGLVLCPLCYVEGRTCRCGETQPVQCRPFSDLLETRDRAVRAIQPVDNNFATAYGPLSEQPSRLLSERTAGVFEAACKLFQQRQSAIVTTRSCRARSKVLSHQVPITAAIYCKYCHSSKCYTHLLEVDFIHSITAIFTFDRHDAKAAWHQFHRNSSKEYEDLQQRAIKDEEMGTRPDTLHRLTYLAKAFTTCRAIAPELTKHGWYDRYAQTSVIPIVTSPARVLVGLPEAVEGDESCASEVSGNAHATGSSKQGSVSRGGSLRRSVSRSASKPASVAPATSPRAITERVIAEVPPSCQSSILPVPNSLTPILDSQSISLGVAARQTPKHASLAEFCSSPVIRKPSSLASVQSPVADDTGSSSDLTDLPTEFNSSPLVPIVDVNLMSVVPDSEASNPPTPTKPSIFLPAVSATSSPPFRPLAKLKTRQRLVLDCVEIQPPEWYEKMRAETQAVSVSSSQGKRKQSEVLLVCSVHPFS
ncbi:hypothetical protein BS17DRAFT_774094 [Gyrodon lividus]|nr:hypothetical protein BS17DRAFT_774094 [Gyrodon lividus]